MAIGYKKNKGDEKQAADEKYDPYSDNARDLYRQEHDSVPGYDRDNDGLDDHPVTGGDASGKSGDLSDGDDKTKNIDDIKDKEDDAGGWANKYTGGKSKGTFNLKNAVKKKGPLGALILLLGGGGIGIVGLLSPSLLLVQITDMFTNNFNDAHTALSIRTNKAFIHKFHDTRRAFAETSDGRCGIRCKFSTTSDTMVRNLKANNFEVETNKKFGRHTIVSMKFPDGTVVNNGNDFRRTMRDPSKVVQFHKVYNSRTAYFLNGKFGSMLGHKLGINKAYKLVGDSKEKFKESFRRSVGLPPRTDGDDNRNKTDKERLDSSPRYRAVATATSKLTKPTNAVAGACLAYNTTRAINASLKIAKMSAYAAYAMTFFNAAHKLKAGDGGGIDPTVTTELGNILTSTDPNKTNPDGSPNEKYGLSATDSYGYKAAAYGDTGEPPEYAKKHSIQSSGMVGILSGLTFFAAGNPTARSIAHGTCKPAGSVGASFLQCIPAAAAAIIGYFGCLAANIGAGLVIGAAIEAALPKIIAAIVDTNLAELDENTTGVVAGDALYPGAGSILGGQAASYGMKAGNKQEISNYVALGEEIRERDRAVAQIDAEDEPFNIYNKYSFLGSMVRSVNLASYANSSFSTAASTLVSTIPRAFGTLTLNTNAGTYMPLSDTKAEQYGGNDCEALESIGAVGDAYCMPSYTKSNAELNADIDANLDYMLANGYIDPHTGAPATTDEAKDFRLFVEHCVNRIDALGETSQPIESGEAGDYEWFIGNKCNEDSVMLHNFRVYAMDEPVNASISGEDSELLPPATAANEPAPSGPNENSGNVAANGWAFPTKAGAPISGSAFNPPTHPGLDIGIPGSNVPIFAVRDGTVTSSGNIEFPYRQPCSPNGTTQQVVVIKHNVGGTVYYSAYHHVAAGSITVRKGATVQAGDRIATMGNTGCSFGQHLHFEIWRGGQAGIGGTAVNPTPLLY
ncbi:MAG TPA: M23 family metallopeptidase [Candidatus Saccharimonadales bacterium]|nr:M23 family metallopeptidase [Candidatus Saccharimonadales bacterium]